MFFRKHWEPITCLPKLIILTRGYRQAQDERARRKNNSKYTEGACQENMADI